MDGRRIDLNSADLTTLLSETALDIRRAEVLISARPLWDSSELRMLPGFGRKTLRDLAVVARVVPPSPININTCAPEALHAIPGVGSVLLRRIVSGRPYGSLDDLADGQGISRALMRTLRERADVVERKLVQGAEPVPLDEDLLDLNLCDEADLRGLPLVGPTLARRIVVARPFADVDSLLEVEGIGPALLERLRQACELTYTRPEAVEAELVDDENWFTEGNFEPSPFEAGSGLPQLHDPVMSLVAYEAAVEQEIRRRMPLLLSGWVVAVALIIGMLLMFFSGFVQVEGLMP